jgi:poly-gamma-glutamate capsule biosynthesis protein CapA/YwtB (metallophosphatase superfamily)
LRALLAALSRGVREGPAARFVPWRVGAALERWTLRHAYPDVPALRLGGEGPAQATLIFGGDLALHRLPPGAPPEFITAGVRPALRQADLAGVNLESQLTVGTAQAGTIGTSLRADPGGLDILTSLGIGVVTCANNHCLDFGAPALAESIGRLRGAGIAVAGIRDTRSDGGVVVRVRGMRVGMLAFSDDWRMEGLVPGGVHPAAHDPANVREAIARMAAMADLVVVQLHWGYEYYMYPMRSLRDLARSYAEAGAHLVICHHAHVPLGVEAWHGAVIAHGLGNFYFGAPRNASHPFWARSYLLRAEVRPGAVVRADVLPVRTDPDGSSHLDTGAAGARTLAAIAHLSGRLARDRYLDRVETDQEYTQAGVLFLDLAHRLGRGDEIGVRERVTYFHPPRQRVLTASLRRRGGLFAEVGALFEALRDGTLDPLSAAGGSEIRAMAPRVQDFQNRQRPVGRIP